MKRAGMLGALVVLLGGCSPFNTVPLYRDYTPMEAFLADREACVQQAGQCIAKKYAHSSFMTEPVERLLPSRGAYLRCMSARGYYPSVGGFTPPVFTLMTDYPPGRDC